jgi:hypothetical protein
MSTPPHERHKDQPNPPEISMNTSTESGFHVTQHLHGIGIEYNYYRQIYET